MSKGSALDVLVRRHLRAGWIGLLVFLTMGIVLEALHALKAPWYLDVGNSSRRLMWTLGHSHGTLFSLVQLAFVATFRGHPSLAGRAQGLVSWGLIGGQWLLPMGFVLGGLWLRGGEPGLGIFLVPVGAALLLAAVATVVWNLLGAVPLATEAASPESETQPPVSPPQARSKSRGAGRRGHER